MTGGGRGRLACAWEVRWGGIHLGGLGLPHACGARRTMGVSPPTQTKREPRRGGIAGASGPGLLITSPAPAREREPGPAARQRLRRVACRGPGSSLAEPEQAGANYGTHVETNRVLIIMPGQFGSREIQLLAV